MGGASLGLIIEALVAVLLLITIAYCLILHRKLQWLRSDQSELKQVIRELNVATAKAEQTITALCTLSNGSEASLQARLAQTKELTGLLATSIAEAEHYLAKLDRARAAPARETVARPAPPPVRPAVRASQVGLGLLNARQRQQAARPDEEVA